MREIHGDTGRYGEIRGDHAPHVVDDCADDGGKLIDGRQVLCKVALADEIVDVRAHVGGVQRVVVRVGAQISLLDAGEPREHLGPLNLDGEIAPQSSKVMEGRRCGEKACKRHAREDCGEITEMWEITRRCGETTRRCGEVTDLHRVEDAVLLKKVVAKEGGCFARARIRQSLAYLLVPATWHQKGVG